MRSEYTVYQIMACIAFIIIDISIHPKQLCVQLPTSADDMTLPALLLRRGCC